MLLLFFSACTDNNSGQRLVGTKISQLNGIRIKNKLGQIVFKFQELDNGSKTWVFEDSAEKLVEQVELKKLISLINYSLKEDAAKLSKEDSEQYGIGLDSDSIELTDQTGMSIKISIGDYSDYHEKFFAALHSANKLLMLRKELVELIRQKQEFYEVPDIYQPLLAAELTSIKSLNFKSNAENDRSINRLASGSWQVGNLPTDQVFVQQAIIDLTQTPGLLVSQPLKLARIRNKMQADNLPDLVITVESENPSSIDEFKVWRLLDSDLCLVENLNTKQLLEFPLSWYRKIYPDLEILLAAD